MNTEGQGVKLVWTKNEFGRWTASGKSGLGYTVEWDDWYSWLEVNGERAEECAPVMWPRSEQPLKDTAQDIEDMQHE